MSLVAEPLFVFLVALLVGWVIQKRSERAGQYLWIAATITLYGLSTSLVSKSLLQSLEVDSLSAVGSAGPRAIVILGGDISPSSSGQGQKTVGRLSLERLRQGARLGRKYDLPVLITGGVVGDARRPVSLIMKDVLEKDFEVPVAWAETSSRNTFENAKFSARYLRAAGIDTVLLVTHAWHMGRAREAFRFHGIETVLSPSGRAGIDWDLGWSDFAPRAVYLADSAYALHEVVGVLWYRIRYY